MNRSQRIISKALVLGLIPIVMLLFHNQLSNWHYHILSNGMLVKHAHPYNKSDFPGKPISGHTHTDIEFFLLGQLTTLTGVIIVLLALASYSGYLLSKIRLSLHLPLSQSIYLSVKSLRGPPSTLGF